MYRLYNTAPSPPSRTKHHHDSCSTVATSVSEEEPEFQLDDRRSTHSLDSVAAVVVEDDDDDDASDTGHETDTDSELGTDNEESKEKGLLLVLSTQVVPDNSISKGLDVDELQAKLAGEETSSNDRRPRSTPRRSRTTYDDRTSPNTASTTTTPLHTMNRARARLPLRTKSADCGGKPDSVKPPLRTNLETAAVPQIIMEEEEANSNQNPHEMTRLDPNTSSSSLGSQEGSSTASSLEEPANGNGKPQRRRRQGRATRAISSSKEGPLRTKSTGSPTQRRQRPSRAMSTPLRRNHTTPCRRPSRQSTVSTFTNNNARRNSAFVRGTSAAPQRTRTRGLAGLASRVLPKRSLSRHASQTPETELNLFGASDMIRTDFLLQQIQHAKDHPNICRLEVEDFLDRHQEEDLVTLSLALQDLFLHDDRPWELVTFVDTLRDGLVTYPLVQERKAIFWKHLGPTLLDEQVIPYRIQTKVHITGDQAADTPHMVDLLRDNLPYDASVTVLHVSTPCCTLALVHALTDLWLCDRRKWEHVTLTLSGECPSIPGTPEHDHWTVAMQTSTAKMQAVAQERGISLE